MSHPCMLNRCTFCRFAILLSHLEIITLRVIEELAPFPVICFFVKFATAQNQMPIKCLGECQSYECAQSLHWNFGFSITVVFFFAIHLHFSRMKSPCRMLLNVALSTLYDRTLAESATHTNHWSGTWRVCNVLVTSSR